jgi:hypothetical protein
MRLRNESFTGKKVETLQFSLFALITSFLFLYFMAHSTSPLHNTYGGDSAIFMAMGRLFLLGKVPYTDFFDHKGPILIFIEALGQKICASDRTGVFILQVVNLTLAQCIIWRMSRLFLNRLNSLVAVLFCLLSLIFTLQGGNMSEEYSLPFILGALFYTVQFCRNGNSMKPFESFLMGLCLAVPFWIRLNNTGVVCACTLCILTVYIQQKKWAELAKFAAWFAAGFGLISAGIVAYFYLKGGVESLRDLIYASFLFNLKYVKAPINSLPELSLVKKALDWAMTYLHFIVLVAGTALFYKTSRNKKYLLLSVALLLVCYAATHIRIPFLHYMTLNIPLLALGLVFILASFKGASKPVCTLLLAVALAVLFVSCAYKYTHRYYWDDAEYTAEACSVAEKIPESERDSVYGYEVRSKFWMVTKLVPCYKYFVMQEWHGRHDERILQEIDDMMDTRPPLWFVEQFMEAGKNERLKEIIRNKYVLYDKTEEIRLYRLNDMQQAQAKKNAKRQQNR